MEAAIESAIARMSYLFELGGPVVMVLLGVSVGVVALVLYKLWQFSAAGVGRHKALKAAVSAWDAGQHAQAQKDLRASNSYLASVIAEAFASSGQAQDRLLAQAEMRFSRLERGFRFLDTVAQLAPLLGLFGTVLGMIDAFQALQDAGAQVDPSILAGGIWVALLTTAVGLVVAMPAAMILAWFEGRMQAERVTAETLLLTVLHPMDARGAVPDPSTGALAHA
ncbi:MAG: MotA/TolQ/ExbB proton channel family protein [Pseudomonadota bacterium]